MNSQYSCISKLRLHTLSAVLVGLAGSMAVHANPVIEGNARFTVITPNCIRIEQSDDGRFIDDPSTFAVNRDALFDQCEVDRDNGMLSIDTGAIRLVYKSDGAPLGPGNLSAEIRMGEEIRSWTPGAPNKGNLGGTIRTLDMVSGPVDLGEGLLSREWMVFDRRLEAAPADGNLGSFASGRFRHRLVSFRLWPRL